MKPVCSPPIQNSLPEDGNEGQDGDWPSSVTSKQQNIKMSETIRLSKAFHSSLTANNSHNDDDDDDEDEENDGEAEERTQKSLMKEIRSVHLKEPEDMSDCFLVKRELNIKANKAMVNHKESTHNSAEITKSLKLE